VTRAFVTGVGLVSSLGNTPGELFGSLLENRTAVRRMPGWENHAGLKSLVAAPARPYDVSYLDRSSRRTMTPMSEMALLATRDAFTQADLKPDTNPARSALVLGSTIGSPVALYKFFEKVIESKGPRGLLGTSFFKVMNHTVASNVAVDLKFRGAVLSPSAACCTSTQAIAMGWEMLQSGLYDFVVCGGADELDFMSTAVFDIVGAASTGYNDAPERTARPFDKDRDGLVVSEGAGVVILETEEHALRRGARPLAEVNGGAYHCDGRHMAHPDDGAMADVMQAALARARLEPSHIDYVNAHATATVVGDAEEIKATHTVFGHQIKVSSLKGHTGHSLAACGAIETIACIEMMNAQTIIGTRNLDQIDPGLAEVDFVTGTRKARLGRVMVNNFAFGGISASIIVSAMEAGK
jgi:3-oxoacyl-[acyl-carrier-protein] synthase II